MFGSKKLIAAKEAHISDLKAEITYLRSLVFPTTVPHAIPLISQEADAILSQKEEVIDLSPEERAEVDEEISERNRILSGNY